MVTGEVGVPVLPNLNAILPMLSCSGVNGIPINDVLDVLTAFSEPLFCWSIFTVLEPNPCNKLYAPSYDESLHSWLEFTKYPNNSKWAEIAENGRNYTMNYLTNDTAANSLVDLFKEYVTC